MRRFGRKALRGTKALGEIIASRCAALQSSDTIESPICMENLETRRLLSSGIYDHNGFYIVPGGPSINTFSGGGTVAFLGSTTHKNTESLSLSSNGQTLVATLNGTTSDFPVSMVAEVKMWGGNYGDTFTVASNVNIPVAIQAGTGNDTIIAVGGKADTIHGNLGNDSIELGSGNSIAWGEGGNDTLICGTGNQSVFGNAGADSIKGGPGTDELMGGGGGDTVVSGGATNYGDFVQTVATPPVTSSLTPEITASSPTTIVAGHIITVQALYSGLPSGVTPLTALYQWNFGDTTSGSQYNQLEGFNASHLYDTPGKYTITLTITLPGGSQTNATLPITVTAPSTRTIYVSTSGSDSNNGLSSSTPVQTVARAEQLLSSNTNLLFQDGDTFDMSTALTVNDLTNVVIGSYGSGAQPVLMWTGPLNLCTMIPVIDGSQEVTVQNLTFNSIYNQNTNETGMPFAVSPASFETAVVGCTFLDMGTDIQANGAPSGLLVENNSSPWVTGLRAYFVWIQGSDISILGNTVANSTREDVIRQNGADRVLIAYNTLSNIDRTSVDPQDIAKAAIALEAGEYDYVFKNTILSGDAGAAPLETPGTSDPALEAASRTEYVVYDSNVTHSVLALSPGTQYITFRNNISYMSGNQAYLINAYSSEFGTSVQDVTIVNNTAIDTGDSGNFLKTSDSGAVGIVVENNLFVAPNLQIGLNGSASVYLTGSSTAGFTFSNNVWASGIAWRESPSAQMFIDNSPVIAGYISPATWNAEPGVGTDSFVNVVLNSADQPASNSIAATGGLSVAGVILDADGVVRTSGLFGVGALLPEG